jgi:phosphoribosylformylglycinamidine (FGAM) synthase-like enzyme
MNDALGRRVFLSVLSICLLAFALTGGIALLSLGDLGVVSAGIGDGVSATAKERTPTLSQLDPNASAQQQLAAAAGDIAGASADLSQVTAEMEAANK